MVKTFLLKQINTLKNPKEKSQIIAISTITLFIGLNAFKLVFFNYCIIPTQKWEVFEQKFFMTVLLVLVIYPLLLRIRSRVFIIVLYILQTLYILANIAYYSYYHSYLHVLQWFTLFEEGLLAAEHFAVPIGAELLVAFIDLPVFIYMAANFYKIHNAGKKLGLYQIIVVVASMLTIISIEVSNYANNQSLIKLVNEKYWGETPIVEKYGVMVNEISSLFLRRNEMQLINCFKYGNELSNTEETIKKPNFVIIQVESMDSNVINHKYNGSYITPYLRALSNESIYYPYVMSYHKGGSTSDCEFSVINSVEPLDGFPAIKLSNYKYQNSMILKLAQNSYETIAFHGNAGRYFNRDAAFPKMGFMQFFDMEKMHLKHVGWGAPDSSVFDFALEIVKNLKQPFLSYIITMTSHGPFTNAGIYYNNSKYDDIADEKVKNYFKSMSYVDQTIKDFMAEIKNNYKDSYIFIFGDHVPAISTDIYKQASFAINGSFFEFVPLIIITPDNQIYKENKKAASLLDISPTVLYSSGIPFKIDSFGEDLIKHEENPGNKKNRNGRNKIPYKGNEYTREELFDKIANRK